MVMLPWVAAMLIVAIPGIGPAAKCAWSDGPASLWLQPLAGHGVAVALVNRGDRPVSIDVIFARLGVRGQPRVRNITKREDWGVVQGGFAHRVEPRQSVYFRLLPPAP